MALELVNKLPYDHPYRWDGTLFGGPKLWRPDELGASLALWLDAEDTASITLNGSTVSQWNDKSGNSRNAVQAVAANQPIYVSGGINGVNSVSFDGNDSLLSAAIFASANDATVICALQYNSLDPNQSIYSTESSAGGIPAMYLQANAGTLRVYGGAYVDDGTYTVGQVEISAFSRGASTGNLWRNGTQVVSNAAIGSSTTNGGFLMGRLTNGLYGKFEMGEVVALNGQASTANRQKLEGYLAWKWGLEANLPGTHPYRYTPPTTDEPAWDADALDYIGRVQDADGQGLERNVRIAIDDFVKGCKADGIWNAIKASCIMAGARTLSGALVPLAGAAPTNFNFVSGDYNRETGLLGNGTTKYLDSNRNNNTDPQNNKHMAVYVGAAPTNTSALIGAREGVSLENGSSQLIHVNASSSSFRINSLASATSVNGIGIGLAGVSRTGASAVNWRHSSSFTGTDNATSQTPFSVNMHVFQRAGTSGNVPTNARLAFYSIGEAIDLALLDTRVSALMTAIDGAIP